MLRRMETAATIDEPVERVVAILRGFPEVRRVILFGSRAIGDATERSDIDLAVSAPGIDFRRWAEIAAAVDEAPTLLDVDLVWLEDAGVALRETVAATGVVVDERS